MQAKFCNKCGNAINEGEKFCRRCGTPVNLVQGINQHENAEGTVILGGLGQAPQKEQKVKSGMLTLSLEEMLRGCSKVVDFGTGKRYEINIPAGLNPGDVIKVKDTGIIDPESLDEYEIELVTTIR